MPKDTKDTQHDKAETVREVLQARMVPVDLLDPDPNNPRTMEFTEEGGPSLKDLAASIESSGIIMPLVVVPHGNRYRIVAGHRRIQAAKMAGLKEVPVVLHKEVSPEKRLVTQLVENIQRQNLPLKDLYASVVKLKKDYGLSATEIAKELGRSKSWVTLILSVAESHSLAKKAVDEGMISDMTQAYNFNTLPKDTQEAIYDQAKETGEPIRRAVIEAAKNPPPSFYQEETAERSPAEISVSLPAAAFRESELPEDRRETPNVQISQENGVLRVQAPIDNFIRLLTSLGRPVDTEDRIVRGVQDILA